MGKSSVFVSVCFLEKRRKMLRSLTKKKCNDQTYFKTKFWKQECISLYLFVCFNFVRPLDGLPLSPLHANAFKEWENWARIQIMSSGSDLFGKTYNLQVVLISALLMYSPFHFLFVCLLNSLVVWFMKHYNFHWWF